MTIREAEMHSYEELELLASAADRKHAADVLELGQFIIAGQGDSAGWNRMQKNLIEKIKTGL